MTTIDATETELRDTTEVLKLAAILDDRAPAADRARIAAWAEQIHRHRLTRKDLLDGLQAFYDGPSSSDRCIQIGDLIHHARNAKRTRTEREPDQLRDNRRQLYDQKAAADLLTQMGGPAKKRSSRLDRAELALQACTNRAEAMSAIAEFFDARRADA